MHKLNRLIVPKDLPASVAPRALQGLFAELLHSEPARRPSAKEALARLKQIARNYTIGPGRLSDDHGPRGATTPGTISGMGVTPVDRGASTIASKNCHPTKKKFPARIAGVLVALVLVVLLVNSQYSFFEPESPAPIQVLSDREPICVLWQASTRDQVHCEIRSKNAPSKQFDCLPSPDGSIQFTIPRLKFGVPYTIELSQNASVTTTHLQLPQVELESPPTISQGPGWITLRIDLDKPAPIKVTLSTDNDGVQWSTKKSSACSASHIFLWTALVSRAQRFSELQLDIASRTHPVDSMDVPIKPLTIDAEDYGPKAPKKRFLGNAPIIGNYVYLHSMDGDIARVWWPAHKKEGSNTETLQVLEYQPRAPSGHVSSLLAFEQELVLVTTGAKTKAISFEPTSSGLEQGRILSTPLLTDLPSKTRPPATLPKGSTLYGSKAYLPLSVQPGRTVIQCIDLKTHAISHSRELPGKPSWAPYATKDCVYIATHNSPVGPVLFAFNSQTLAELWKLRLKGPCYQPVRESDGWLWVCDTAGVYRLRPDRKAPGRWSLLQVKRGEAFLELYGAVSPPIRIGDRGWMLIKQKNNWGLVQNASPAVTNFAWETVSDLRKPIALPHTFMRAFATAECFNVTARDGILYALFGLHLYAIDTNKPKTPAFLTFHSSVQTYSFHPDGRLVVVSKYRAYFYRLWPEEPSP